MLPTPMYGAFPCLLDEASMKRIILDVGGTVKEITGDSRTGGGKGNCFPFRGLLDLNIGVCKGLGHNAPPPEHPEQFPWSDRSPRRLDMD